MWGVQGGGGRAGQRAARGAGTARGGRAMNVAPRGGAYKGAVLFCWGEASWSLRCRAAGGVKELQRCVAWARQCGGRAALAGALGQLRGACGGGGRECCVFGAERGWNEEREEGFLRFILHIMLLSRRASIVYLATPKATRGRMQVSHSWSVYLQPSLCVSSHKIAARGSFEPRYSSLKRFSLSPIGGRSFFYAGGARTHSRLLRHATHGPNPQISPVSRDPQSSSLAKVGGATS